MRNFRQEFIDVFSSGYIREDTITRHIEPYIQMEKYLPDLAAYFYVLEYPSGKYRFLGRQQEHISGYPNEEVLQRGIDLFLHSVHPGEIDILLHHVYPDMIAFVAAQPDDNVKKGLLFQYNYRYKRKDGTYVNLLDNMHILELDDRGRASLVLGNVILLQNGELLPLRLKIKQFQLKELAQTVFSRVYTSLPERSHLTTREMEILGYLALGYTSRETAQKLSISPLTVDTHRRHLLRKLECNNVVEMTRFAFRNALL
jgi:DNA-binding CsgD family transcriptional regulator